MELPWRLEGGGREDDNQPLRDPGQPCDENQPPPSTSSKSLCKEWGA